MEIGIGLPSTVPGTTGPQLTGWARQADASGFSSEGWILGGGAPDQFSSLAHRLDEAWADEGRDGRPMKKALAYFALGPDAADNADRYLKHYYAWLGEDGAAAIAGSAATSEEMVRGYASAFEQAGCDELIFFPCSSDRGQVRMLAEAAGRSGVARESPGVTV